MDEFEYQNFNLQEDQISKNKESLDFINNTEINTLINNDSEVIRESNFNQFHKTFKNYAKSILN